MNALFEDAEIIHTYTRAQAIEDGVLIDITDMARARGFVFPVAITAEVQVILAKSAGSPEYEVLRRSSMLAALRHAIACTPGGLTKLPFHLRGHLFECCVGPGDDWEPVLTIMLPGQD